MTAAAYLDAVGSALADGWSVAGLHAAEEGRVVRVALAAPDGRLRLESAATESGAVPSLVELAPRLEWDEREAADLYGVAFIGHEPHRSLVDHAPELARWTVPVLGHDSHQLAVGPVHAGVIESGHFRFHLVGEKILYLDARLFYKHRGLERAAEGATLEDGIAFAARACMACNVTNATAYAQACEEALGLEPSADLARVRTILLELERVWSHLNDVSAICAGTGFAAGTQLFGALSERARRLNERIAGHRYLLGAVHVGRSDVRLEDADVEHVRAELDAIGARAARAWRELTFNGSFQDRLSDIGIVTARQAATLGTVGPAARAAGLHEDARTASPRLAYRDFAPAVGVRPAGDVQARLEQRPLELEQSLAIVAGLLEAPVPRAVAWSGGEPRAIGVARVESPRGATLCVVEHEHGRLTRLRLRTGSYANWPSVAFAAAGNMLPDFPLVNKSFELCYACADR